jgi:hypothetical protein
VVEEGACIEVVPGMNNKAHAVVVGEVPMRSFDACLAEVYHYLGFSFFIFIPVDVGSGTNVGISPGFNGIGAEGIFSPS